MSRGPGWTEKRRGHARTSFERAGDDLQNAPLLCLALDMCGIFFSASCHSHVNADAELVESLQQRGPDAQTTIHTKITNAGIDTFLTFSSTVLSLRGAEIVTQPLKDEKGSVLCWNGEAWLISGRAVTDNDTAEVFNLFRAAKTSQKHITLAHHLARISGPYALVFLDHANDKIYFGRDLLGRRSLLWSVNPAGDFLLSSVTSSDAGLVWQEVEADGTYCIDLRCPKDARGSEPGISCGRWFATRTGYVFNDTCQESVRQVRLHTSAVLMSR